MVRPVKVGDVLWYVPNSRHQNAKSVTVTKVGRKYFDVDGWAPRIAIDTWLADGGQHISPGACYESEDAHKAFIAQASAWSDFRRDVSNEYTSRTIEQIADARAVLR